MSKAMRDVLTLAAVGLAGFVAIRVAQRVKETGAKVIDAATAVITTDLNPANRDNVINRGVSAVGGALVGDAPDAPGRNADGSWSFGAFIYDVTHTSKSDAATPSDLTRQAEAMQAAQEDFRRRELDAQRKADAEQAAEAYAYQRRREDFRLSEIEQMNGYEPTSFDKFMQTIAGQR